MWNIPRHFTLKVHAALSSSSQSLVEYTVKGIFVFSTLILGYKIRAGLLRYSNQHMHWGDQQQYSSWDFDIVLQQFTVGVHLPVHHSPISEFFQQIKMFTYFCEVSHTADLILTHGYQWSWPVFSAKRCFLLLHITWSQKKHLVHS